jgi:hypothetical protein
LGQSGRGSVARYRAHAAAALHIAHRQNRLADLDAESAMAADPHLASGLNVAGGAIRHEAVANALNLPLAVVDQTKLAERIRANVAGFCGPSEVDADRLDEGSLAALLVYVAV